MSSDRFRAQFVSEFLIKKTPILELLLCPATTGDALQWGSQTRLPTGVRGKYKRLEWGWVGTGRNWLVYAQILISS